MDSIFSVELKSKRHVRSISISDQAHDRVLFEGDLGRLLEISIIEHSALEMVGGNGVLRIEIDEDVLQRVLESPDRELSLSSEVGSYRNTNKKGDKKMKSVKTRLVLAILLSMFIFTPAVYANRKVHVRVYTVLGDDFVQYDDSEPMPNGFTKVDACYKFSWYDEDMNYLGYALQYIEGIAKAGSGNDFQSLHGYGVYYSEVEGITGTITYTIGNKWVPGTGEQWALRARIVEGTDDFDGIKGKIVLNSELFAFELYLDFNPWA